MSSITMLPDGGKIVKTNCFECHAKCGVLCYVDREGELLKVKGNPEDPRSQGRMCSKGLSAPKILYDPHRLRYPLRRIGERGEGKWEKISWGEAMDWLVEKVKSITDQHGAEAITYGQGTGRGTNQWTARSGNAGGRVHHSTAPGNICLVPMMVQAFFQFGMFPTFDGCDFDNADCIVFWGANSVWTEPTYTSGQVGRSRDRGAKLIVIDPFYEHPLAAKADHFVPVRPGSDAFLAMAWLNIIINEDLYDHDFVTKYTNAPLLLLSDREFPVNEQMLFEGGDPKTMMMWDKKQNAPVPIHTRGAEEDIWFRGEIKAVDGSSLAVKTAWWGMKERADAVPPEKAATLCWMSPDKIYDACRTYAKAERATINVFQGIEEQTNCKDSLHLIYDIIAITGNLEKKGTNLSMPFWNQMRGLGGAVPPTQNELRMRDERASGSLYGTASNPSVVFEAMRTGKPYPIKGYISVQGNPLSWSENTKLVRESLMHLDLLCVMDYYMSPTCELADLVLPSTHWTERDYIADEVCSEWVFGQQKAVEPLYERKSDIWFWRTLGNRLNPEWWPWESDEELFDWQLAETKAGVTWPELKEKWMHKVPDFSSRNYQENGFPTPSGRVELYSIINLMLGARPFGEAIDVKEGPFSAPELAEQYPIVGVTGRRYPIYYHSAYRGIPHLRELVPEPQVIFSSILAKKLGVKEGDDVWIESPTGRIAMKARPSDGLHERVCVIPHGWWQACPELNLPGYPDDCANVNVITGDRAYNDEYFTPGLRSTMCRIYKK